MGGTKRWAALSRRVVRPPLKRRGSLNERVGRKRMIAIIDYGMGNVGSLLNMFRRLGIRACVTSDRDIVARADRLILPGVGAYDRGVESLRQLDLVDVLWERVVRFRTPILGVCLGMQLFTLSSEEGSLPGLGWVNATTRRFPVGDPAFRGLRVPHMGWNAIEICAPNPLLMPWEGGARYYFAHSYHVVCHDPNDVLATCQYGIRFTAALRRGNIFGTQFHPEKSHHFGMRVLKNFAEVQA